MPQQTSKASTAELRRKIAREAASLLYFGSEKEYKQAKLRAAKNFGAHILPSNIEVALELDAVAEEIEGPARKNRLIQMRGAALNIMKSLAAYCPVLIGSVWRGTIRRGSDIDIELYSDEPEQIAPQLKADGVKIASVQRMTTTEQGRTLSSLHIHAEASGYAVEIVVRALEEAGKRRICDTFGDEIKGFTVQGLEKVLKEHPDQRFVP